MTTDTEYKELFDKSWQLFINYKTQKQSLETVLSNIKNNIVTKIYFDEEFKVKIRGMMYRNNISINTQIDKDVVAEVIIHLMKIDTKVLFEAYCEDYSRIFALSVTIAVRCGFSKMNKEIHQNASVAKQILYKSNLNSGSFLCTNDEMIHNGEDKFYLPQPEDSDLWQKIRDNLTIEQNQFLDFLLDKVLQKKYSQSYSRELRKNYYSYNEYRILRLELQNRIKDIIKNNEL